MKSYHLETPETTAMEASASHTASPSPSSQTSTKINELLDEPDADIILRSSDSVDFRTYKCILGRASPLFKVLLYATQSEDVVDTSIRLSIPNPEWKDGLPVLRLSENRHTLQCLLSVICPIPTILPTTFRGALRVLSAARKYEMDGAWHKLCALIKAHGPYNNVYPGNALRAYGQACRYGLKERAQAAASLFLEDSRKLVECGADLRHVTGPALSELVEYRRKVISVTLAFVQSIRSATAEGLESSYRGLWKCKHSAYKKNSSTLVPPQWWFAYWRTVEDRLSEGSLVQIRSWIDWHFMKLCECTKRFLLDQKTQGGGRYKASSIRPAPLVDEKNPQTWFASANG
ncbi:hypothetical protein EVG20_g6305 [Dentipellis fragilis]|uniref:BTB domain-containing protein n=1 Tax=Dentipellis fragilis TaxID=205917 RepID=A0A4Y9YLL7_9AGAM|nr:hypothetical protein EVG20_g6305 [Dentipellis fragilis]